MRVYVLEWKDADFTGGDKDFKAEVEMIGEVLSLKEFEHRFNEDEMHCEVFKILIDE